jgi:hypothetical protein
MPSPINWIELNRINLLSFPNIIMKIGIIKNRAQTSSAPTSVRANMHSRCREQMVMK